MTAHNKAGTSDEGVPVCQSCGKPMDDIETMGEPELLEAIHLGLLRDLARSVRGGGASHQELAIARGLLRDNKKVVPAAEEPPDETLPPQAAPRDFPEYGHDE